MIETVSILIVLLVSTLFSLFIYKRFVSDWDGRGDYGFKGKGWMLPLSLAVVAASLLTAIISFAGVALFISVAFGLLTYFLAVASLTDARTCLIPKELSSMALIVGLVFAFMGFVTAQYYVEGLWDQHTQLMFQFGQFAMVMFFVSFLFVVTMFRPSFGFGDIKMFWATGLFMASFIFIPQLLMVFMGMFVIMGLQLVFRMLKTKSWKISGGLPALPAFAVAFVATIIVTNLVVT